MGVFHGGIHSINNNCFNQQKSLYFYRCTPQQRISTLHFNYNEVAKMSLVIDKYPVIITIHTLFFNCQNHYYSDLMNDGDFNSCTTYCNVTVLTMHLNNS